ncbi:MAG: response regulator [Nitrospiraceae bacterium]|nr:response regulator [Nitrospiraceae bacterium]
MAKIKILIVDDSVDTRLVVSARLKKHGYDTAFAADALQAIAIARQTQPDAIILDLGLPGGSGFIVLQRLKANTTLACIPVIILTADESPESEFKGLEAGAVAFLHKPVQEESLIAAVECAVGGVAEYPITNAELRR